jgi:DNA-binding transcriptional ArsR family regulator
VALTDDITDPRVAKALAHPLRLEILRHLGDRTASPSEIAAEIGAPLTNVSYHVRKLRSLGLIKLVRKTPKRGVVEHYYSAKPRPTVSDEAWAQTPDVVKAAVVEPWTQTAARELVEAARSGGFNRKEAHFTTTAMKLDERAWREVSKLLLETLRKVDAINDKATERLESAGTKERMRMRAMIGLYEVTEQPAEPGSGRKRPAARGRSRAPA